MAMKAIKTLYNGIEFKSRFESEVAMLLDKMGWSWEYEPESFLLPSGHYMPDFRATDYAGRVHYVEARGYDGRDWQWKEFSLELPYHSRYTVFLSNDIFRSGWAGDNLYFRMCEMAILEDTRIDTGGKWLLWVPQEFKNGVEALTYQSTKKITTRNSRVFVNDLSITRWHDWRPK